MSSNHSSGRNSAYRINVTGRVQGVGFRYSAQQRASHLRLTGWIRNEYDGSVELYCEGAADAVEAFIEWLDDGGPSCARIINIQKTIMPVLGTFSRFSVEY
jgi:acylphosphatase